MSAEPIGVLDFRVGTWNNRPIEYMNGNASIRPDIEAGTPEQYADILAPNYQYEDGYHTDYIYKTPMDMLYFSISLGIRFGGASFRTSMGRMTGLRREELAPVLRLPAKGRRAFEHTKSP